MNGVRILQTLASESIGKSFEIERIVPEYEVRLDKFGQGRQLQRLYSVHEEKWEQLN